MQSKFLMPILALGSSLIVASCVSIQGRIPASSGDERLTLREMQILSKDATFKFFKGDATKSQAQAFVLSEAEKNELPAALNKLRRILHKPMIDNSISVDENFNQTGVDRTDGKKEVRITSWNIERGQQLDEIKQIMSLRENGRCSLGRAETALPWRRDSKDKTILDTDKKQRALEEACALNESDVLILNEVDDGICRSGYHAVASELAQHLGMNYVFAPQFFEAEPGKTGLAPAQSEYCKQENLNLTKNLTGNAILSRYPI